jgi:hypothetical protein
MENGGPSLPRGTDVWGRSPRAAPGGHPNRSRSPARSSRVKIWLKKEISSPFALPVLLFSGPGRSAGLQVGPGLAATKSTPRQRKAREKVRMRPEDFILKRVFFRYPLTFLFPPQAASTHGPCAGYSPPHQRRFWENVDGLAGLPPLRAGRLEATPAEQLPLGTSPGDFPPCSGLKSSNWPAWSRLPRGCTLPSGPAKTSPAWRSPTASWTPSAHMPCGGFRTTWTCSRAAPATGGLG